FDLTCGSLGVLQACYVAANLIASGHFRTAMVMSAEIELNRGLCPTKRLGLEETGAALILDRSAGGGAGFASFPFPSCTRHIHQFASHSAVTGGTTALSFERDTAFETACVECIRDCVGQFLKMERLNRSDISVVLAPLTSASFVSRVARILEIPEERMVFPPAGSKDFYTASLPV